MEARPLDPIHGGLVTKDFAPDTNNLRTLGTKEKKFSNVRSRLGTFVGTSYISGVGAPDDPAKGTVTFDANQTGVMAGNVAENSTGVATLHLGSQGSGRWKGCLLAANATSNAAGNSTVRCTGGGSAVIGTAYSYGDSVANSSLLENTGFSCLLVGYSWGGGSSTVQQAGSGSIMAAYQLAYGTGLVYNQGAGAIVAASCGNYLRGTDSTVRNTGSGSIVAGRAYSGAAATPIGAVTSLVENTGQAGIAIGFARAYGDPAAASVRCTATGGFANGYAYNQAILASGQGSFARGIANSGYDITASGIGSFAIGSATTAAIVASATNACQFGPGANALADSVQFGAAGLRVKGTTGAPGTPQNGDMWVASSYVYVRSNGVSVKIV